MRLKVVLYNPRAVFYTMPLALLAVGSELDPEKYEVVIVDGRLEVDPEGALLAQLDGALCVGITVLTGRPLADALRMSRTIKEARPDLPVIWGGWHPSMFARECLAEAAVDVAVRGQGEATFVEIVKRLSSGQPLDDVRGATVRCRDGSIRENPARALLPLEAFRAHDYRLIPVERYFELKGKRQLDFISSQGCNFRCAFCSDPFVYERKWVGLDPGRMALRLRELWQRYRFDDVNFQDETFFTRRSRIDAFVTRLLDYDLKITWAGTMRADQGVRLPAELWERAAASGLRRLLVGVESGSDEMLKRIRKDIRLEQVFRTADLMVEHGIAGHFPFIVGFPDESDASVRATVECAKQLRGLSADFCTPIFYFKPYPGSEITIEAVRNGYRLPRTLAEWSRFDYVDGEPGPWVSRQTFRLIERFKFFSELACRPGAGAAGLLRQFASYRCRNNEYRLPLEMLLERWLMPAQRLS